VDIIFQTFFEFFWANIFVARLAPKKANNVELSKAVDFIFGGFASKLFEVHHTQ
jgi:hypothetical protein